MNILKGLKSDKGIHSYISFDFKNDNEFLFFSGLLTCFKWIMNLIAMISLSFVSCKAFEFLLF
jgi:hypothetical protein